MQRPSIALRRLTTKARRGAWRAGVDGPAGQTRDPHADGVLGGDAAAVCECALVQPAVVIGRESDGRSYAAGRGHRASVTADHRTGCGCGLARRVATCAVRRSWRRSFGGCGVARSGRRRCLWSVGAMDERRRKTQTSRLRGSADTHWMPLYPCDAGWGAGVSQAPTPETVTATAAPDVAWTPELRQACQRVLRGLVATPESAQLVLPQPRSAFEHYFATIPHPRDLPTILGQLGTYLSPAVRGGTRDRRLAGSAVTAASHATHAGVFCGGRTPRRSRWTCVS